MDEIKSAFEIAKEKIERLGEPTEEERLKWKYAPLGEQLAVKYLKEDTNLVAEMSQFPEKARRHLSEGAAEVLIRNISLPKNEIAKKNNRKAMDGLKFLKSDRTRAENVYSQIRHLFTHYSQQGEEQRKQTYEALKTDFEAKFQQAVQQQLGSLTKMRIDVEKQPQFQEEWRRMQGRLEAQYLELLEEYKRELSSIS